MIYVEKNVRKGSSNGAKRYYYYYFCERLVFKDANGRKKYKRRMLKNVQHPGKCSKRQALVLLERFKANQAEFQHADTTFYEVFQSFSEIFKDSDGIVQGTIDNFFHLSKHYLDVFKDVKVKDFDWKTFETWRQGMIKKGYADSTITHTVAGINKVLEFALRQGMIQSIPNLKPIFQEKKRKPKRPKKTRLDEEEIALILEEANPNLYRWLRVLLYTGLRPKELIELKQEDIDLENRILTVHSSNVRKAGGIIPIPSKAIPDIEWLINNATDGRLSPYQTRDGAMATIRRLCQRIERKYKRKIYVTSYVLRKTFSSRLSELSSDRGKVAEILRHSLRVNQTHYTKMRVEYLRPEIEKLDYSLRSDRKG